MPPAEEKHPYSRRDVAVHLTQRTLAEFLDDRGPQLAASISYHVLFSLFPLAIVLTALFSIFSRLTGVRASAINTIVDAVPLSESGASSLRHLLEGATGSRSSLGLLGLVGLIWAASGMMAALRSALNAAWDVEQVRPFLKGKLIDIGLVFAAATGILASLGVTIAVRLLASHAPDSPLGSSWATWLLGAAVPLAYAFALVFLLYRFIPAARVEPRYAWPPALGVAVLYVLGQNLFAFYLQQFGHYNALYGSLGAVVAFMFFVYLGASVLLLGAELASEWPRSLRAFERGEVEQGPPFSVQLVQFARGLWVRERQQESERETKRAQRTKGSEGPSAGARSGRAGRA
jgi:membrane protein